MASAQPVPRASDDATLNPPPHADEETSPSNPGTDGKLDIEKNAPASGAPSGPPAAAPAAFTFPDGGLKAWSTVLGAWLVLFVSFGYVNSFGVFQEYYLLYYLPGKSSSDLAWVGSFQLFLMFFMSFIAGKLFDEGYFRYLLGFGSIIYVVSLFMVSISKHYYSIFLSQGLGMGVGVGIMFLPAVGAVAHHFHKRRALATGIVVSGSSVGGIVFPIMLNKLFLGKTGFAWGVRASAFIILGCLIVANLLITTRLPPRKLRPAHLQVKPDMKGILTDVPYLVANAGLFFVILGLFFPLFYIQVFASAYSVDANITYYALAILNAGSVFGRVLPNFLADLYGPINLVLISIFMCGVLIFVLLACGSNAGVVCFAIFYGFFSGAYVSLIPSVQAGFARNIQEIGVRMGLPFTLLSIGALVGSPIVGELIGSGPFVWWKGSVFAGTVVFFGCGLLFLARQMQAKRKGKQIV